jgi:hypothetical protein
MSSDQSQGRIEKALSIAMQYSGVDDYQHKAWVIDQMVRALTGCPVVTGQMLDTNNKPCIYMYQSKNEEYLKFVTDAKRGEHGEDVYYWEEGIAP